MRQHARKGRERIQGGVSPLRVALVAVGLASCTLTTLMTSPVPPRGEWPTYGGTNANARYSSLDQITRDNVRQLRIVWRWTSPDEELMTREPQIRTWLNEATPLMIGGVLYVSTSASQVAAIDGISGRTRRNSGLATGRWCRRASRRRS